MRRRPRSRGRRRGPPRPFAAAAAASLPVLVGEDQVQPLARLVDHSDRLLPLLRGAGLPDLGERLHQAEPGLPDLVDRLPVDPAARLLPGGVLARLGLGAARLGEREELLAALALAADQ